MKRFLTYLLLASIAAFGWSCIKETAVGENTREGKDIRIQFRMAVPSAGGQSRALDGDDTGDEVRIEAVDIPAFVKAGDGKFRYAYSATNINRSGTESEVEVVATVKEYPAEQIFLILCNAADELTAAGIRPNEEIDVVLARIQCGGDTAGEWPAKINGSPTFKPFPMYARTSAQVVSDANNDLGDFPLVRMVARADITLKSDISNFVLVDARVYNRTVCGYVPYDFSGWNGTTKRATSAGVPAGNAFSGRPEILASTVTYEADDGSDPRGEIRRSIYLFESEGVSEADRLKGAAIIVGGKYGSSVDVTYYRIDIKTDATPAGYVSQDILRNHWYQIEIQSVAGAGAQTPEDAYKGDKPIDFTVSVTNWGAMHDVPLISLYEPDYFIIDHTYNTEEIHLHMVTQNQEYGHFWYTYANVPDGHNSEDEPPAGLQVSPPRKNSCASLYSKDPSNPWRLPTWGELLAIRDYVLNNGGVGLYNFDLRGNAFYLSATAQPGEPHDVYMAQIYTGGTGDWYKGDLVFGAGGHARCVRNKTGGSPTPGTVLTTDADGAYFAAISEVLPIKVTSNTKWIAQIKPGTNVVTTGDESVIGLPLINKFNGGSPTGYITGGVDGISQTDSELTILPEDYISQWKRSEGQITIMFRDANTGILLNETTFTVGSGKLMPKSNSYMVPPIDKGGYPLLIPIYEQVSRAFPQLGASWITESMLTNPGELTTEVIWTDNRGPVSGKGQASDASLYKSQVIVKWPGASDAYLFVLPGKSYGNSAIGIKYNSTIKWTWHVWVTDYKPKTDANKSTDGQQGSDAAKDKVYVYTSSAATASQLPQPLAATTNVFMDRNLGAYANNFTGLTGYWQMGLLYQWGRKDGFVGALGWSGTTVKEIYGADGSSSFSNLPGMTLTQTVNNPWAFSTVSWPGSNGVESWGNSSEKTVYDPCPDGWRVPKNGAFNGVATSATYPATPRSHLSHPYLGLFPMTGYMLSSVGSGNNVGSHGYCWTATAPASSGYVLYYYSGYVHPNTNGDRTSGFPIRCIQE